MSWYSSLSTRGRTLLVGSVITVGLVAAATAVPIPYVKMGPGVTINTLGEYDGEPVFTFTGAGIPDSVDETFAGDGHLNMTTVSVTEEMTLLTALATWATGRYTLTPYDEVYPPGKTTEQVKEENSRVFAESQSIAQTAALRHLGYPEVTYVQSVTEGGAGEGILEVQDRILEIDGVPITDTDSLRAALADGVPGQVVSLRVRRTAEDGSTSEQDVKVTLGADEQGEPGKGYLGIVPTDRPEAPFTIHNSLERSQIGGPSAGLMFTLALIDRLTPGDMTGGHFIAGTGTMNLDLEVGAIGGILLKLIAAEEAGAEYFLVPAENCDEALTRVPAGLRLARVSTVEDAVAAVEAIAAGRTPPGC